MLPEVDTGCVVVADADGVTVVDDGGVVVDVDDVVREVE